MTERSRRLATRALRAGGVVAVVAALVWPGAVITSRLGGHHHPWTLLAISLGYTAFGLLCLQLILAARTRTLDRLYGSDRLLLIHRAVGPLLLSAAAVHVSVAPFVFSPFTQRLQFMLPPLLETLPGAAAATAVLLAAGVTAVRAATGVRYDVWRRVHLLGALALPLAMTHAAVAGQSFGRVPLLRGYVLGLGAVAGFALLARAARRIKADRAPLPVTDVTMSAERTTTIRVERPAGFSFRAGQFCEVGFGGRPPHPFTIASPPEAPYLEFTIRRIGEFTRAIGTRPASSQESRLRYRRHDRRSKAPAGPRESPHRAPSTVSLSGPYGRFTPDIAPEARTFVFIAGGIGITPFASSLRSEAFWRRPGLRRVLLIWSIRRRSEAPYYNELAGLAERDRRFLFYVLHTGTASETATHRRSIDSAYLAEHCPADDANTAWFLCGPAAMMRECGRSLRQLGVPRRRIHAERFQR